jgi:mannose-6-phosphate isomerase-like protein (cupin superfamily)
MPKGVSRQESTVYELPERDWYPVHRAAELSSQQPDRGRGRVSERISPSGHVHESQEEVIYVISGHVQLVTPERTIDLKTGTSVYIRLVCTTRGYRPARIPRTRLRLLAARRAGLL